MNSPEASKSKRDIIASYIADAHFKFWHGYTREDSRQFAFWSSMDELLRIDGTLRDIQWIKAREHELITTRTPERSEADASILAYGRARLEDYCRHQGTLADGRVVTRIPAYLADKEQLAQRGILYDNFIREDLHESSDDNLTVILPTGWTMHPADAAADASENPPDPLGNERWAGVYDETDAMVVKIFYNCKPYFSGDDFRSHSKVV